MFCAEFRLYIGGGGGEDWSNVDNWLFKFHITKGHASKTMCVDQITSV